MSDEDQKAALVLQKSFRGHQARSNNLSALSSLCLSLPSLLIPACRSSKARWEQLLSDTHGVTNERDTEQGKNDPENRWHRALHASSKISNEDSLGDNNEDKDPLVFFGLLLAPLTHDPLIHPVFLFFFFLPPP